MSQERIDYLDRQIAKLRNEQNDLMQEYDEIDCAIVKLEKEADRLEAVVNDESYGGTM